MIERLICGALPLALSAVLFGPSGANGQPHTQISEAIRRELTRFAASGAAVALVVGDSTVLLEGFGTVRHDDGAAAVTADLPFGTVRLRDALTALLAVRLDELGRLDLDAPIGAYAADLPPRIGAITLRQLFSHTAGLDDAQDVPSRRSLVSRTWPGATDAALFTEPGAIHSTSRHSLPLARAILQARTGRTEAQLLAELVFAPTGMRDATLDAGVAERRGAVPGHVMSMSSTQPVVVLTPTGNPMPQLFASARDLGALMRSWMRPAAQNGAQEISAISFHTVAAARIAVPADPMDSIGLGVVISHDSGFREISYSDGRAGYGVLIRMIPEARVGIAIVANATGAVLARAADAALAPILASLPSRPAATRPVSAGRSLPEATADYAGTYANGDRIVVLEARAGTLFWRDADLALPVTRTGARLDAVVGDGRVAQSFHFTRDAAGVAYVVVDGRAYRRQPAASRTTVPQGFATDTTASERVTS